jgi:hypothetical protein
MSKAIDIADEMVARINNQGSYRFPEHAAVMSNVKAIVDRQLDIEAEIDRAVKFAKGKGAIVTIFYQGWRNADDNGGDHPRILRTYTLSVYAVPILRRNDSPADDIVEACAYHLHHWDGTANIDEISVKGGDARPDPDYLVYDATVEVIGKFI